MHLDNVAVSPSSHGKGIGGKLIGYCEEVARRLRLYSVELYTNQMLLRNIAIYEHLGYELTDRRLDEGFHRFFSASCFEQILSARRGENEYTARSVASCRLMRASAH